MKSKLSVRVLSEAEYPAWNRLVAESPDGSLYSSTEYLDILCGAAGGRFSVHAVYRSDEMVGGIALYEPQSRFFRAATTRSLLYYNSIIRRTYQTKYPSQETSRDLEITGALEESLAGAGFAHIEIRCRSTLRDVRSFIQRGWIARPSYTYVVPLDDLSGQWTRVEQNLRRLVDRCTRDGITLTWDDDFDVFVRMHSQTLERKQASLYLPEASYRRYFERLRSLDLCRLYHARLPDGTSAAAQLVLLGAHPVSHTVAAASDSNYLQMGASAFLRWRTFEHLAGCGFAANDLTDASLISVAHFKSQFGASLEVCLQLSRSSAPYRASLLARSSARQLVQGTSGLAQRALKRLRR